MNGQLNFAEKKSSFYRRDLYFFSLTFCVEGKSEWQKKLSRPKKKLFFGVRKKRSKDDCEFFTLGNTLKLEKSWFI